MRVSIFVTCLVDQFFPKAGMAMASVLEGLGYSIHFPEAQTCCGQPAFNSGFREQASQAAAHFLNCFEGEEYIVVPSGSCCSMIQHHFQEVLSEMPEKRAQAVALSSKVWEFSRFLIEVAGVEDLGATFPAIATYHDSCHALRELNVKTGPRRLLSHVKGLELREVLTSEECCGFGGTFSVKFPGVSVNMARTKLDDIMKSGADTIVSIDSSCLMQLQGVIDRQRLPLRTVHLAEVLASH